MTDDPLDPTDDPFGPPEVSIEVECLHCGQQYQSDLIEWRIETDADGGPHGFWCCPTPRRTGQSPAATVTAARSSRATGTTIFRFDYLASPSIQPSWAS